MNCLWLNVHGVMWDGFGVVDYVSDVWFELEG